MTGWQLCILAFLVCLFFSSVDWRQGLCALMTVGYFYGILRAHFVATYGHFIFDAACSGFYVGMLIRPPHSLERARWRKMLPWFFLLIGWPAFMALLPMQHYLIQLVGLRGNIFFLPFLLVGCLLDQRGKDLFVVTLAILNIVSLCFGLGEYFIGVDAFVPSNEVTTIIFNSADVAGGNLRIPSIFLTAHAYAGTMIGTLPWLVGEMVQGVRGGKSLIGLPILVAGTIAALMGVFIAGPRSPIVILGLMVVATLLSGRVNFQFLLLLSLIATVVTYLVSQNERMQRFTELQDLDMVRSRIEMSVNMTFFEVLLDYPMGNGIGAGGTSIPFFLQHLLDTNVKIENEYARILLEQGLPGLVLFLAFTAWFCTRKIPPDDGSRFSKTQIKILTIVTFSTAFIGLGLMSAVPGTATLLLGIGYFVTTEAGRTNSKRALAAISGIGFAGKSVVPAYQRGLARV